ncbi:MAG TPA: selenocysteine-specific translation elongation factor [Candidatus Stackebrandtia excrementipullorum]|nr:selenocysteine-specific translation elongation factor [Candidatus Stackebrandtia excrementipullorum]
MRVIATAGHVDHGKSTLLATLTGQDPDRLAEEKRRGLTIELGFVSMRMPDGDDLAFVDVPGHHRYLANTLTGISTAPAVLFVVAANEGWKPQSEEHLASVTAFGIRHVILAVTKTDLADPEPATSAALDRLHHNGITGTSVVPVSAHTGDGLDRLRETLDDVTRRPRPSPDEPVRLWIDRVFSVPGAGTVVTGTLNAGTLTCDSEIELSPQGRRTTIRALHCLGRNVPRVTAPARVAVNLRRIDTAAVHRGDALVAPGRWWRTNMIDVRLAYVDKIAAETKVHCGTAAVAARARRLGPGTARLTLARPVDLHNTDRVLVRETGSGELVAARVLDVAPPPLRGRGAAALRGRELVNHDRWIRHHRWAPRRDLIAMGESPSPSETQTHGDWVIDNRHHQTLTRQLFDLVTRHEKDRPLANGLSTAQAARLLDLPDEALVAAFLGSLHIRHNRLYSTERLNRLSAEVVEAAHTFTGIVGDRKLHAPTRPELTEHNLTPTILARAVDAGLLLRVGDVHLLPDAVEQAMTLLTAIPQPFSVAEACRTLNTTRRVAIPLLEHLDRRGDTRRQSDGRRRTNDN